MNLPFTRGGSYFANSFTIRTSPLTTHSSGTTTLNTPCSIIHYDVAAQRVEVLLHLGRRETELQQSAAYDLKPAFKLGVDHVLHSKIRKPRDSGRSRRTSDNRQIGHLSASRGNYQFGSRIFGNGDDEQTRS